MRHEGAAQGGWAMKAQSKVVVVMPAYNAGSTLKLTYEELPKESVNLVILVDDGSKDQTLEIARELGLEIFVHDKNYGYGANQKTCYTEALKAGAAIVVMVHPDYQYDPTLVPKMIEPIVRGEADLVLGSRLKGGGSAVAQGMPWWKYISNRFVFDQEIIAQCVTGGFRIAEIAVPVRYFPEASSASFFASCGYGLKILWVVTRYLLHRFGLKRSRRLLSLRGRYSRLGPGSGTPAAS